MRRFCFLFIWPVLAGLTMAAAPQTQNPANGTPPQPPAGAANGPQPGPAAKGPGPGERTGETAPNKAPAPTGGHGDFLAIGTPADPAAAERGQKLFVANCAFCHGSDAHGGNSGPDLVRSVLVLHDKGSGGEIGPVILHGRTGKGMPAFAFSDAQIKDIAQFLLSRSQAAANRMNYTILNIVTGDPKAGEAYFGAHCANCHSAAGDLAHVATKYEPVDLQSKFLYPKQNRNPLGPAEPVDPRAAETVTVKSADGQSYSGALDRIDDFSVSLTDSAGQHHSWSREGENAVQLELHDPLQAHVDLLKQYTDADMHNILAYLETFK